MRLMLASDIHGSAYYAEKMRDAFLREKADKLILLGDLLYHGPRNDLPRDYDPKRVIEILNAMKEKILCVRGNCDTEVDQMVLDFPILADYALLYLDGRATYITHGHKINPDNPLNFNKGDILINGHTHIPANEDRGDFWYINTGSVSIPKNQSPHSYMVYENGEFKLRELYEN